jgi:hypothetical protein
MLDVAKEVAALNRMAVKDLRDRYAEVFGDETKTGNKPWLVKRIAWRLQAMEDGDLSERARRQAHRIANDADLRFSPPKPKASPPFRAQTAVLRMTGDQRITGPGAVITREYKGRMVELAVLPSGFEFEGTIYKSLSAAAKAITGSHCNGFHFFRLKEGSR